ncbi:MAG: UpxY family transcription antiterminator [Proteobacteria bacterium]|nr:UpxY family transcription antiterminator [Pseudomonadota bacterium]
MAPSLLYRVARWYACHTRARAEKQVNRLLRGIGVESYLPLVELQRQWADRKKCVAFPLFPGYVFAQFDLRQTHEILRTPGVVTIVRTNGYPSPLRDEEIASVRILMQGVDQTGILPSPADYLASGEAVVVTDGPFRGMRGTLLETRGPARVAVRLSGIHQAMSVELDRAVVQPTRIPRR